jgi:hypothetical protein
MDIAASVTIPLSLRHVLDWYHTPPISDKSGRVPTHRLSSAADWLGIAQLADENSKKPINWLSRLALKWHYPIDLRQCTGRIGRKPEDS